MENFERDKRGLVVERRLRVVRLGYHDVMDWFIGATKGFPSHVSLPVLSGLPGDRLMIVDCRENPRCRTFDFFVAHSSFDPVPECEEIPVYPNPLTATSIAVKIMPWGE